MAERWVANLQLPFHSMKEGEREYNATDWNKYVRVTKHWIELIASIIEWCILYMYPDNILIQGPL